MSTIFLSFETNQFHYETDLIEYFLNGIKSPKITYLWSDFASKLIDGQQANGEFVERSFDRFLQSNTDVSNFNFENCIDWYWVYSNGYEEYSHTTCGSSCDENTQDACLDDGNIDVGGGVAEEEAKICGTYAFTSSGNSLTTEIRNLGMTAVKKSFTQPQMIPIELGPMCFNFSADLISSASASNIINEAFNRTTKEIQQGLNNGTINATNIYVEFKYKFNQKFNTLKNSHGLAGNLAGFSFGPCLGEISFNYANYICP